MYTYLWTGKDAQGVKAAQKVTAASAEEARAKLEAQGFSDLRLLTDEISAEITAKCEPLKEMSAAQRVKLHQAGRTTFWRMIWKVARDVAALGVICGLLMWWRWHEHDRWALLEFGVILAGFSIFSFIVRANSYLFSRMIEAREWHRADDVLRLLRWMELAGRFSNFIQDAARIGLRPEDAARYRSLALIWQGKVEEGLAAWKKQESKLSPAMYASHLGGLYEQAGNLDRGLELAEQVVQLSPQVGGYHVDLAWKHLFHERSLPRARQAMAQAEKMEQTDLAKPFLIRNRGIIAMREGKFLEAEQLLEEALGIWAAHKKGFFRLSNMMLTKGFLCQARARLGKVKQAREDFAECKEWLKAVKATKLLEACEGSV